MAKRNRTTKAANPPEWLNKKDMAASLGISVQAFTKWGVTSIARRGRETFFTVRDVLDNRLKMRGNHANH